MKRKLVSLSVLLVLGVVVLWVARFGPRSREVAALDSGPSRASAERALEAMLGELSSADGRTRRAASRSGARDPAAAEDVLARLIDGIRSGDAVAGSQALGDWFDLVPDPVDEIIARLATLPDREQAIAFAFLLGAAVHLAATDPERVEPWTPRSIGERAIEMIDSSEVTATAIRGGLAGQGEKLPGELLGTLVRKQGRIDPGRLNVAGQVEVMNLAEEWVQSMDPSAEESLLGLYSERETDEFARGQSARLLLLRDWRAFEDPLLAERARFREEAGGIPADESGHVPVLLVSMADRLDPVDREEYLSGLVGDEEVGLFAADAMTGDEAHSVLGRFSDGELPEVVREKLLLRAGGEGAAEAGYALLRRGSVHPNQNWAPVVDVLLQLGADGSPEFQEAFGRRFDGRHAQDEFFWDNCGFVLDRIQDDARAQALILPWVERSAGETDRARQRFLEKLHERFPDLPLD